MTATEPNLVSEKHRLYPAWWQMLYSQHMEGTDGIIIGPRQSGLQNETLSQKHRKRKLQSTKQAP